MQKFQMYDNKWKAFFGKFDHDGVKTASMNNIVSFLTTETE